MPPSVNKSNAKHYKSATDTDYYESRGPLALDLRRAGLGGGRRLCAGLGRPLHRAGSRPVELRVHGVGAAS
jgi:hypothetical protein